MDWSAFDGMLIRQAS